MTNNLLILITELSEYTQLLDDRISVLRTEKAMDELIFWQAKIEDEAKIIQIKYERNKQAVDNKNLLYWEKIDANFKEKIFKLKNNNIDSLNYINCIEKDTEVNIISLLNILYKIELLLIETIKKRIEIDI